MEKNKMEAKNENKEIQVQTMSANDAMMQTLFNPVAFEQMQRAAGLFAKSGLVPKTFENNMPACFVGLQLAAQLGVNPFMLFQKIYSVNGKIGIEAQVAIAVANQRKIFSEPMNFEFSGEGKSRKCTCSAPLTASKKTVSLSLTWAEVQAEGWDKKSGSKWNTIPDQMFRYRTALWLIRTYAPEVLMGLNSIDEMEDIGVIDITPTKVVVESEPLPLKEKMKKAKEKAEDKPKEPDAPTTPIKLTGAQEFVAALAPDVFEKVLAKSGYKDDLPTWDDKKCSNALNYAGIIEDEEKFGGGK